VKRVRAVLAARNRQQVRAVLAARIKQRYRRLASRGPMSGARSGPPWDFFHDASIASLQSFELSRLNNAANIRRQVAALLDQWVADNSYRPLLGDGWAARLALLELRVGWGGEFVGVAGSCGGGNWG
jgi:hypothetical protein